ncbi:MAG: hypothetical protein WAL91_11735, partial [Propionicimonas sp.]
EIVTQGITEGSLDVPDAKLGAWFVLGGLQSVERAGTPIPELPDALERATVLALRALGAEAKR